MAVWWLLPAALGVARVQERQDPHLRWSQAPPRPWRRPGSADICEVDEERSGNVAIVVELIHCLIDCNLKHA